MKRWQLREAKNRFSQVAEDAAAYGPQLVTKRGRDAVVILSVEDYERLTHTEDPLVDFLLKSPLAGSEIVIERKRSPGRTVEW